MNIDIKQEIKKIVLNTQNFKYTFLKKHPNSKYSLDFIIDEILYFLKSGVSYRMLRSKANFRTIHYYHSKFVKHNIFFKLYKKIRNIYINKYYTNKDAILLIDSTIINNKFGINKIGRNKFYKNKKSTKISLMTDNHGFPLSILFMKGNYHDTCLFEKHIKDACVLFPKSNKKIIADKAYASHHNYALLKQKNIEHIIPPRKNMKIYHSYTYDKNEYIKRTIIENIFARLKINRRLSFRYEKFLRNFSSFVFLAFSYISINIGKNTNVH